MRPDGADVAQTEDLDVMLLDLVAHLLNGGGIVFHDLDLLERRASGLFLVSGA